MTPRKPASSRAQASRRWTPLTQTRKMIPSQYSKCVPLFTIFLLHSSVIILMQYSIRTYTHTNQLDKYINTSSHVTAQVSERVSVKARDFGIFPAARNGGHILGLNPTCAYVNEQWEIVSKG
jgi:hypothetical protein